MPRGVPVSKLPWFQFFAGDWLKDPQLSVCAPATRGIWIDMLSAMHESGRSGELCGTVEQLARIGRCSTKEMEHALDDLRKNKAASIRERNGLVTVTNRRMSREFRKRQLAARRQVRHRDTLMSRVGNAPVTGQSHISEVRVQKEGERRIPPKPPFDRLMVPIPAALDKPEFLQAWHAWLDHQDGKGGMRQDTAQRQLTTMAGWGIPRSVAAINHSIEANYTKLVEPKEHSDGSRQRYANQSHDPGRPLGSV